MSAKVEVTYKVTLPQSGIISRALENYKQYLSEAIKNMSPHDGQGMKQELLELNALREQIGAR